MPINVNSLLLSLVEPAWAMPAKPRASTTNPAAAIELRFRVQGIGFRVQGAVPDLQTQFSPA